MTPDLVVVGHVGESTVRTSEGTFSSPGGSGFAVAASAGALIGGRAGLVARVGLGCDLAPLRAIGVNLDGVLELPGATARLFIRQHADGTRTFTGDLGVAAVVRAESFPESYLKARFVHLGTAPPSQQLTWLEFLRRHAPGVLVSADMFEAYVASDPVGSREVCDRADFIFMNQAEHDGLYADSTPVPKAPLIIKRGRDGATLMTDGMPHDVPAARDVTVADPTGGGEVLAGVFLALRSAGLPESAALPYAVRAASSCVQDYGVHGQVLVRALADIRSELSALLPG
jgi:sugar/nucleoside kinase (ribokinase family)